VGCGEQHQAAAAVEAVELGQQLVEGLLLLVMPAAQRANATGTAEGVQLVDEDDRWCLGAGLLEQVADPCGADTDEHFDELRAGDGEEGYPGLAGHGLGQQGLAGAGWANQQDALGHAPTESAIALGVLEEVDDFLQLLLGLVDTGDI